MPDLDRYHRQTLIPEIGLEGQQRIGASHVTIVGCGALGCAIADLLARAGVGRLTLIDRDVVELTNLQRQTLFDERDARDATPKADAAVARLRRVNSSITIAAHVTDLSHANAESLLLSPTPPNVILDGTDNLLTRYLLNDVAIKHAIPFIYGGAIATRGMSFSILPARSTPCLRCLFPDLPESPVGLTCDTAGILGPVVSMVAAHQSIEALKILAGSPDACRFDLLEFDLWSNMHRRLPVAAAKDPNCICCANRQFDFLAGKHTLDAAVICTRNRGGAVQFAPTPTPPSLADLARRLQQHGEFTVTEHLLRGELDLEVTDSAFPIELTVFRDGRVIVRGTADPAAARSIYAKYVGA